MSVLDDVLEEEKKTVRKQCGVCKWLKNRDDAGQWDAVMADPTRENNAAIMRAMQKNGWSGTQGLSVRRHRAEKHRG